MKNFNDILLENSLFSNAQIEYFASSRAMSTATIIMDIWKPENFSDHNISIYIRFGETFLSKFYGLDIIHIDEYKDRYNPNISLLFSNGKYFRFTWNITRYDPRLKKISLPLKFKGFEEADYEISPNESRFHTTNFKFKNGPALFDVDFNLNKIEDDRIIFFIDYGDFEIKGISNHEKLMILAKYPELKKLLLK